MQAEIGLGVLHRKGGDPTPQRGTLGSCDSTTRTEGRPPLGHGSMESCKLSGPNTERYRETMSVMPRYEGGLEVPNSESKMKRRHCRKGEPL